MKGLYRSVKKKPLARVPDHREGPIPETENLRRDVTIMPHGTRSSWGCIQKIGPRDFRLRWTQWEGREQRRRSKTLHGVCRREADAEMHRLWELHHVKPWEAERPCPTFKQCWDEWYMPEIASRLEAGEIARNTANNYIGLWRKHVSPLWGATVMSSVREEEYQAWLLSLSRSNARLCNILVGNMVNCARLHGIRDITFRDARYKMPQDRERPSGLEVYTLPETDALLEDLRGSALEAMAILMAKGSCRNGEALAASTSDIGYATRGEGPCARLYAVYDLTRQYESAKTGFMPCKTPESVRPVIVPPPWSGRIREIAAEREAQGLAFLTDGGKGAPMARGRANWAWRKLFSDGVTTQRYLPMQKLRNSWATAMLWKHGMPSQMVDKMMGHSVGTVLGRHYDRPDEELFIEALDRALFPDEPENQLGTLRDI